MRKQNHDIERAAHKFLEEYNPQGNIPVLIEEIIEFDLKIQIVPIKGLLNLEQIDAFVSRDSTQIYIDEDSHMQQTSRSRFTLAHEVGHIVMHQDIIKKIQSLEEWRKFVHGAGTGRAIYETEANIFAGCVLMPKGKLLAAFEQANEKVSKEFSEWGLVIPSKKDIIPYAANEIAKIFDVSVQCATIRLERITLKK